MPLSWEDEIPPSHPLHDITGAAGAGSTVQETFITPSFLKLAIIPMISIVRIYYKDITTISDPRHSPDLMDRHNYHAVSPCPSVTSSSVITWTPLPSAPWIREQVFILCWSPGSALTPSFILALLRGNHLARSPTPPHTERQRGHRKGRQEHASGHPSQPGWHPPHLGSTTSPAQAPRAQGPAPAARADRPLLPLHCEYKTVISGQALSH